ncbi:hypothetical protein BGZ89_007845 [Linnemannia elongata]|nr:hypothetical protein BGZ89_007845 [Linnemannia elongata]
MLGSVNELERQMRKVIDRDMPIVVDQQKYMFQVMDDVREKHGLRSVRLMDVAIPRIELIPAKRLSHDIRCTTRTCKVAHTKTTTISTTHSGTVGLSAEVGAKPFGVGVQFTASVSYGFSRTDEESSAFTYEFELDRGEAGYIAVVNAQISAKMRIMGCKGEQRHQNGCDHDGQWDFEKSGFHESVIMEGTQPRSIIAFVYN